MATTIPATTETPVYPWQYFAAGALGTFFGIVLYKSEVVRWERINRMFLFEEAHMYIIIVVAILVGGASMAVVRRLEADSVAGQPIKPEYDPFQKGGNVYGGLTFGVGWAITAACPGPIYAQIGSGEPAAIATLAGAIAGSYVYGRYRARLPH